MATLGVPLCTAPLRSCQRPARTYVPCHASTYRSPGRLAKDETSFLGVGVASLRVARHARSAAWRQERRGVSVQAAKDVTVPPGSLVLVAGASGGVGQLVVANLLDRGYRVRASVRSAEKAKALFGNPDSLEVVTTDLRYDSALDSARTASNVDAVICCTGTTAFPSARWKDNNGPEQTDYVGVTNLIKATKTQSPGLRRFVFVSSVGVQRQGELPYNILNAFGVLKFKNLSEQFLRESGLPYTILRPGRLTDGPYTSYDLNTLLKATSGTRRAVQIATGDTLTPEATSRIIVAEACMQALTDPATLGRDYDLASTEGQGPGQDAAAWSQLFASAKPAR